MVLFDINLTPPQELDLNFSPHTPEEDQEHAAEADHIQEEEDQEHAVQRHHKDLLESSKFAAYTALKALGKDRPVVKADKEVVAQLLGISCVIILDYYTMIAGKEYATWLKDPSSNVRPRRRVKSKLELVRETQIGEFEAAIQSRIEEEKPKQEKRKGKQPIIEEEKPKEKKMIKRRRGGEEEGQYKKARKAQASMRPGSHED